MSRIKLKLIFIGASLIWTGMLVAGPVSVFCPAEKPAIIFAANELQQALEDQGISSKIMPFSKISRNQKQTRIVLGLAQDDLLLKRLEDAGGKSPGAMLPEAYSIRVTRQDELLTFWALGSDATGAMYAGLALAETIAQDGLRGIAETDCEPYIKKRGLKINVPSGCTDACLRGLR